MAQRGVSVVQLEPRRTDLIASDNPRYRKLPDRIVLKLVMSGVEPFADIYRSGPDFR
jgi:hypothetical protein